jgi:hypothetical protein
MAASPDGHLYILGDVRGNDYARPQPVILKATVRRSAPDAIEVDPGPFQKLRLTAKGDRRDYVLDPKPIADGGQATVFGARHRATGTRVAFKRLKVKNDDNIARMRREIEAGQRYGDNPHVVPVLDFDLGATWLVMPLASDTADEARDEFEDPQGLLELVAAICEGLRRPHRDGWVHRDLKPQNILRLEGTWAISDWGLGRRPRGRTSQPGRTQIGMLYGTEGFAAPELSDDAHEAGPQADIFSLGQLIGWAITKQWPRANRPLIPTHTLWQTAVEVMTHDDPTQRPVTVDDALMLAKSAVSSAVRHDTRPELGPSIAMSAAASEEAARPKAARLTLPPSPLTDVAIERMIVEGLLGRIEFDGQVVTIVKDGYGAKMQGRLAITIDQIGKVVFKPATRWIHGYIQIVVKGRPAVPDQRGIFLGGRPPMDDPLSISFRLRANEDISRLRDAIEAAVGQERATQG